MVSDNFHLTYKDQSWDVRIFFKGEYKIIIFKVNQRNLVEEASLLQKKVTKKLIFSILLTDTEVLLY